MSDSCKNCHFFTPHKNMEVPEPPVETQKFLWFTVRRSPRDLIIPRRMRNLAISNNERGICRRLPESFEKHYTSRCGEFRAAELKPGRDYDAMGHGGPMTSF